jgi:hypothetical protein
MTFTQADLKEHQVWQQTRDLSKAIDEFDASADADVLRQIGDLRQLTENVNRLSEIEPWRFPGRPGDGKDPLTPLAVGLRQATEVLINVKANSAVYLPNLPANLDNAMDLIVAALNAAPMPPINAAHLRAIKSATYKYQDDVKRALDRLEKDVNYLAKVAETRIATTEAAAEKSTSEATAALVELKEQIRLATEGVTGQVTRLDAAITGQASVFTTHLGEWQERSTVASAEAQTALQDRLIKLEEKAKAAMQIDAADAGLALEGMRKLEGEARDMVHATARNTISTQYAQYARRQGVAGTIWSIGAAAIAIFGFIFVTKALANLDSNISTAESMLKSTASLAILGTAAFMAREGAGHRREGRDAKRVQLDLNALEPFISNLGDKAERIRVETAERIFNRPLANPNKSEPRGSLFGRRNLVAGPE